MGACGPLRGQLDPRSKEVDTPPPANRRLGAHQTMDAQAGRPVAVPLRGFASVRPRARVRARTRVTARGIARTRCRPCGLTAAAVRLRAHRSARVGVRSSPPQGRRSGPCRPWQAEPARSLGVASLRRPWPLQRPQLRARAHVRETALPAAHAFPLHAPSCVAHGALPVTTQDSLTSREPVSERMDSCAVTCPFLSSRRLLRHAA